MSDRVEDLMLYVDESILPQDDFFQYANGKWLDTTEIPDDKPNYGAFTILRDLSRDNVKELLEREQDDPEMKIAGIFYRKGINMEERDNGDYDAIKPMLDKINGITNREELKEVIAELAYEGVAIVFGFFSLADRKNSIIEAPHIGSGGISIGNNKDYYFDEDKQPIRDGFVSMLTKLFGFIGTDNPEVHAKRVLDFETKLADKHYDQVQKRDLELSYNKYELQQLQDKVGNLDWKQYIAKFTDTEITYIIVDNPAFYEEFNDLLANEGIENWKSYLTGRLMIESANYLSERFEDASFDFFGKMMQGSKIKEDPWKRVMNLINSRFMIGELIGKIFVQEHFPPEAKVRMLELVNNLIATLEERIKGLEWMGEETKEKALLKLSKITVKIGYPDVWEDYSSLKISEEDSYLNMIRKTSHFHRNISLSRLYKAPDRNKWGMSPQTVNAYYHPIFNEIVFPAAILRFPFFDMNMSDAENYGGIGMVIGHEITHGFDDKGSMFDADGNMKMWWTPDDRSLFDKKTEYFVEEYAKFLVNGKPVNGKLTLGENIADHGGMKIAFNALMRHYKDHPREDDEQLTSEQKFFMSFARLWRTKERPEREEQMRMSDPHSPPKARINVTLANIKEFYDAFDIKEGHKMYRDTLPVLW